MDRSLEAITSMVLEASGGSPAARTSVVRRVSVEALRDALAGPRSPGAPARRLVGRGVAASPGIGVGLAVLDSRRALDRFEEGHEVVLLVDVTMPSDEPGMRVCSAIVSARGGLASHAAVVARQWGIPAVCGLEGLRFHGDHATLGDIVIDEDTIVAVDGSTGEVSVVPAQEAHRLGTASAADESTGSARNADRAESLLTGPVGELLSWADEVVATLGGPAVHGNADQVELARRVRAGGGVGIGLCRTEHQFLGADAALIAPWLSPGAEPDPSSLDSLRSHQRDAISGVLAEMGPLPVTVRLLDAPLHEFVGAGAEVNPMLGCRGVRMALVSPWLYRLQVRALVEAAVELRGAGVPVVPRVMVPMVSSSNELEVVVGWIRHEAELVAPGLALEVGVMIETPRSALVADRLARHVDFFSFGTNDLTQLTWGFSRDDLDGTVVSSYLASGILEQSPFETLDPSGVVRLMALACETGRGANPTLQIGACGEHGADPVSMAALVALGLDSVSVPPPFVPVARLAAAQSVLGREGSRAGEPGSPPGTTVVSPGSPQ